MKCLIVACENLKSEVEMIKKDLDSEKSFEIIYIDSKYHNHPDKLHEELQRVIYRNEKLYRKIIFLYGQCGNAVIELKSTSATLIFPKVSDCISLYLGGNKKRSEISNSSRTYFFTKNYIENKDSLYNELSKLKKKYGDKKAIKMYKLMMENYEYIRIIDTGTYKVEEIIPKIEELSEELDLKYETVNSDLSIVKKIFLGMIDDNFIKIKSGEKITYHDFM